MRPIDIESWTLRVIDQVKRHDHSEDSLVELKAEWPKPEAAARQIAAHANSARGAPILWIIGVDESSGVVGADPLEVSNWFSAVRAQFDYVYPELQDLNVNVDTHTVVALTFQTDRAPYLVKNTVFGKAGGGSCEWEVPWREGRKTRTANREHLVRLLSSLTNLPDIECLHCSMSVRENFVMGAKTNHYWTLEGALYVVPNTSADVVIPYHRCSILVKLANGMTIGEWVNLRLAPSSAPAYSKQTGFTFTPDSMTVRSSNSEVIISGPGQVYFSATLTRDREAIPIESDASLVLQMNVVRAVAPLVLNETLGPAHRVSDCVADWRLRRLAREPDTI